MTALDSGDRLSAGKVRALILRQLPPELLQDQDWVFKRVVTFIRNNNRAPSTAEATQIVQEYVADVAS